MISPNDPDIGDFLDFELDDGDCYEYGGNDAKGIGFCLGFAYGAGVTYTVRALNFVAGEHISGTYRGPVMSTSINQADAAIGDSDRILYISMRSTKYLGKSGQVEPDLYIKGSPDNKFMNPPSNRRNTLPVLASDVAEIYLSGPAQLAITPKEFDSMTKEGCAMCSCNLYHDDHGSILWLDSRSPICKNCQLEGKAGHVTH